MNKESFLIDLAAIDMDEYIILENDGESSLNNLLDINQLLDKYAPLRKITRLNSRKHANLGLLMA